MNRKELKELLQNDVTIVVEMFTRNTHYIIQHNEQNIRITEKQYEFIKNDYKCKMVTHDWTPAITRTIYKILNK